jgi:Uma2 family endonuclease
MSIATLVPTPAPVPPPPPAVTSIVINGQLRLPGDLTDLDAFRRWARSDDCPEKVRFAFLNGILWVDLSMEQFFTHNQVKGQIGRKVGNLVEVLGGGYYAQDGMLLSHPKAGLSTIPDGLFVSYAALQSGRIRKVPNVRNVGAIELEGTADMVLEVVSDSSVQKDTVILPPLYHAAGVQEFWRADARGALNFELFRWTSTAYVPTQLPDGWWRSDLFGRDFLLTQTTDPLGEPLYTLHVR